VDAPTPVPKREAEPVRPVKQSSSVADRRRPPVAPLRRESTQSLPSQRSVPLTPDHEQIQPSSAPITSTTPTALRTGDSSMVDGAAELPLWRLKDVFIEATTLDREIRMLRKRIDPKSRQELTRIIEFCRERLAQANRSANPQDDGLPASPSPVQEHVKPTAAASPRPSLLRQPSVRAAGDGPATTRFRTRQ